MSTFITRLDGPAAGLRLAIKDLIDLAGVPTTAGCKAIADGAAPAGRDAACLRAVREQEAAGGLRIVGKTNLHELAFGITGVNPWFGTPQNPLDRDLVPGGSSSGSAVAVATGEADVALGSDTGGSIRIPAACCGVCGLKTTEGRLPLDGVRPVAPSMDTVGPMAASIAGLEAGMRLLDSSFPDADDWASMSREPGPVGRLRIPAIPEIDAAIDRALYESELEVVDVVATAWDAANRGGADLLVHEAAVSNRHLLERDAAALGDDVAARLERGVKLGGARLEAALATRAAWRAELGSLFDRVELIALPTLTDFPPRLSSPNPLFASRCTIPANLAGAPALSMPVPAGRLPASLQLIGPAMSEGRLIATARRIEDATNR